METSPLHVSVDPPAAEAQWRNGLPDLAPEEIDEGPSAGESEWNFAEALLASLPPVPAEAGGVWRLPVWTDMPPANDVAVLLADADKPVETAAEFPAAMESNGLGAGVDAALLPDQMVWLPAVPAVAAAQGAEPEAVLAEPSTRRGRQGLQLYTETFPQGWEALLEEPSGRPAGRMPALAKPEAGAPVAEAEPLRPIDPGPAVAPSSPQVRSTFAPAAPAAVADSGPGSRQPSSGRGNQLMAEELRWTTESAAPEAAQPMESAELAAGLKTAPAAARPAVREPLPTASHLWQRLSDQEKQLTLREFSRSAATGLLRGEERISVDLHPPELGRVRVVVESRGDQINAHLTLQDSGVGEFFQDRQDALRRHLTDAGVKLGQLTVEVRQQFSGQTDGTAAGRQEVGAERFPHRSARNERQRKAALAPGQKVNIMM